jgi:hypothetical protein
MKSCLCPGGQPTSPLCNAPSQFFLLTRLDPRSSASAPAPRLFGTSRLPPDPPSLHSFRCRSQQGPLFRLPKFSPLPALPLLPLPSTPLPFPPRYPSNSFVRPRPAPALLSPALELHLSPFPMLPHAQLPTHGTLHSVNACCRVDHARAEAVWRRRRGHCHTAASALGVGGLGRGCHRQDSRGPWAASLGRHGGALQWHCRLGSAAWPPACCGGLLPASWRARQPRSPGHPVASCELPAWLGCVTEIVLQCCCSEQAVGRLAGRPADYVLPPRRGTLASACSCSQRFTPPAMMHHAGVDPTHGAVFTLAAQIRQVC